MTALRVGDEIDATYTLSGVVTKVVAGVASVRYELDDGYHVLQPGPDRDIKVTKKAAPKVGDLIEQPYELYLLPTDSVIVALGQLAAQKLTDGSWSTPNGTEVPAQSIADNWRATVVHVGRHGD